MSFFSDDLVSRNAVTVDPQHRGRRRRLTDQAVLRVRDEYACVGRYAAISHSVLSRRTVDITLQLLYVRSNSAGRQFGAVRLQATDDFGVIVPV